MNSEGLLSPPSLQILGFSVPYVTREYPCHGPGPAQFYNLFYTQLGLPPPKQQGEAGDFFVDARDVYYKTRQKRWVIAHFNCRVPHPFLDNIYLCHDESGPRWTQFQLPLDLPSHLLPVATQFHNALIHHKHHQGSTPDLSIHVDD